MMKRWNGDQLTTRHFTIKEQENQLTTCDQTM